MPQSVLKIIAAIACVTLASCASTATQHQSGDSSDYNIRKGPQTLAPITPGPNNTVPYNGTLANTAEESA